MAAKIKVKGKVQPLVLKNSVIQSLWQDGLCVAQLASPTKVEEVAYSLAIKATGADIDDLPGFDEVYDAVMESLIDAGWMKRKQSSKSEAD